MNNKLTPKVVAALAATAVAAVVLIGWFGLVSPQRSKAAELDRRIADTKTQLVVLKASTQSRSGGHTGRASALVLARAMPRSVAMPTVLRQLLHAARQADVRVDSLTPQAATAQSGYSTVPMDAVVTGATSPSSVPEAPRTQAGSRARARLRPAVQRRLGRLAAGEDQLPQLAATIHLNVIIQRFGRSCVLPTASTASAASTAVSASAAGGTP
jgi:hypothetical protein